MAMRRARQPHHPRYRGFPSFDASDGKKTRLRGGAGITVGVIRSQIAPGVELESTWISDSVRAEASGS